MSTQTIKSRVLLKTGTCADWYAAAQNSNFTPLRGEVCIYMDRFPIYKEGTSDVDYYVPGIKIGDGNLNIEELPFVEEEAISNEEIERITGVSSS